MAINPSNVIPNYCKNCTHRFVCSIQLNFKKQDDVIKQFNIDNTKTQQSTTGSHLCRYKSIDISI